MCSPTADRRRQPQSSSPSAPQPGAGPRSSPVGAWRRAVRVRSLAASGSTASRSWASSARPAATTEQNAAARSSATARSPSNTPREDLVGDPLHLVRAGRLGHAGHRVGDVGEPDAGGILAAGLLRAAPHPLAQGVEAPQRAGQRSRRAGRPQVGDGRQAQVVDERDEAGRDRGVVGRAAGADEDRGRLVSDLGDLGRPGQRAAMGLHREGPKGTGRRGSARPPSLVIATVSQSSARIQRPRLAGIHRP